MSVVDTSAALPSDLHLLAEDTVRPRAQWEAHKNAIFDLAWAKACPSARDHRTTGSQVLTDTLTCLMPFTREQAQVYYCCGANQPSATDIVLPKKYHERYRQLRRIMAASDVPLLAA